MIPIRSQVQVGGWQIGQPIKPGTGPNGDPEPVGPTGIQGEYVQGGGVGITPYVPIGGGEGVRYTGDPNRQYVPTSQGGGGVIFSGDPNKRYTPTGGGGVTPTGGGPFTPIGAGGGGVTPTGGGGKEEDPYISVGDPGDPDFRPWTSGPRPKLPLAKYQGRGIIFRPNGDAEVDPKNPKKIEPVPKPRGETAPPNNCLTLEDYGHVLWTNGFQWQDEAMNYLRRNDVSRVAAFDMISMQALVDARNMEVNSFAPGKYRLICTPHYIKDYLCEVDNVRYDSVHSLQVSAAKYDIPALGGEFYITENGRLCKIEFGPDRDNRTPDLGDDVVYPPNPNPPSGPKMGSGQIFAPIYADDIISCQTNITKALWSDDEDNLEQHWVETASTSSFDYCINVYNKTGSHPCAEWQYSIIYADYEGKGAKDLGGLDNETLTKAMYTQFAHILLPYGTEKFTINGAEQDYVYIIDVKRDRYHSAMDPGNWELPLGTLSHSVDTSGSTTFDLTDIVFDSYGKRYVDETTGVNDVFLTNKVYTVQSGSIEDGIIDTGSIGNFYPNHGVIVLSGERMDTLFNFNTNRTVEENGRNPWRLFTAISGSSAPNTYTDLSGDAIGFRGRRIEIEHAKLYFVRVKNSLFNYTNNPTFVSGSTGTIIDGMLEQEKVYFTTIGLYNPDKELLAVGKLSQPTLKSCTSECIFKVKVKH